ncbi:MAG: metallophosphoesterase, partial [Ruminococcus sp.]|nr:metallophosphoesterase [Ruminococcus sp.]
MRVLLLLRGSAGCGKSTWIEQNGLKPYTLSADDIRLLCSSPVLMVSGNEAINQSNDAVVWSTLFKLLELRMQNGEFTVIDATNSKTSEMNRYKELCSAYKYRIYCVDFTDIPIEVTKERNRMRPMVKQVPDEAIEKMYSRFQTQKIPSGITVIKPDELDKVWMKKINLSEYKKVHIIGDIHGCATALKEYINNIHTDEFYIFCGDYIDRGLENAEVVKFLLDIYELKNVFLLEGNHERWLWVWANDGVAGSKEFELVTKSQLDNAQISKKAVRQLYRKIGQCAYFQYGKNTYLVTHAGLSTIPENITKVATSQMIRGVGNYNDFELVADSFMKNTPDNCYQIHGHRNTKRLPIQVNERCFNLEGQVEFGGCLRCVALLPD